MCLSSCFNHNTNWWSCHILRGYVTVPERTAAVFSGWVYGSKLLLPSPRLRRDCTAPPPHESSREPGGMYFLPAPICWMEVLSGGDANTHASSLKPWDENVLPNENPVCCRCLKRTTHIQLNVSGYSVPSWYKLSWATLIAYTEQVQ